MALRSGFWLCTKLFVCMCVAPVPAMTTEWASYEGDTITLANINLTYTDPVTGVTRVEAEVGKYAAGLVGAASGVLVLAAPQKTGCVRPWTVQVPDEDWVALVERGSCPYEDKVEEAMALNASAVVIFNHREGEPLHKVPLSLNLRQRAVVVVMRREHGRRLTQLLEEGTRVHTAIVRGRDVRLQFTTGINRTSVLFVSVSFIVLMIISLAWLVFYYIQRFRYISAKDRLARHLCSAAKKALSKIPVKNLKPTDNEVTCGGECCAVCIEPYQVSDVVRTLPCKHEFHKCCVDPWLLEHRTCPMCKMDILKFYGFLLTGSEESVLHLDMLDDSSMSEAADPRPVTLPEHLTDPVMGNHSHTQGGDLPVTHNSQAVVCQVTSTSPPTTNDHPSTSPMSRSRPTTPAVSASSPSPCLSNSFRSLTGSTRRSLTSSRRSRVVPASAQMSVIARELRTPQCRDMPEEYDSGTLAESPCPWVVPTQGLPPSGPIADLEVSSLSPRELDSINSSSTMSSRLPELILSVEAVCMRADQGKTEQGKTQSLCLQDVPDDARPSTISSECSAPLQEENAVPQSLDSLSTVESLLLCPVTKGSQSLLKRSSSTSSCDGSQVPTPSLPPSLPASPRPSSHVVTVSHV
ncbi:uncharacterized protein LOC143035955 [Oratosquilla oratoria]|uniref:uncharacterized protein LOC143035955 n=1 Tax=Oratosquilla oratoria TaxID=337810 RepID=UPI003F75CFDF